MIYILTLISDILDNYVWNLTKLFNVVVRGLHTGTAYVTFIWLTNVN